ncbi:MAG: RecX family transcriptional regulator [Bacteroidia bacterium]|nr:RecX family transcriptional regulator [Bacteroidia bacterium]
MKAPSGKIITPHQALVKIESWCAYQERCQTEVRDKLGSWDLEPEVIENLIVHLITNGFLSEERFAFTYARGKFRIKKWGKRKIRMELRRKFVPEKIISAALNDIDDAEYIEGLRTVILKRWNSEKEKNPQMKKLKVIKYVLSRGFEQDLINDELKRLEA